MRQVFSSNITVSNFKVEYLSNGAKPEEDLNGYLTITPTFIQEQRRVC